MTGLTRTTTERTADMTRTWLITGSTRGFGHELALAALASTIRRCACRSVPAPWSPP
jgi:NAD(P)-dependent dehydrogenase (short-subunit alcohol dehydrogenase family)